MQTCTGQDFSQKRLALGSATATTFDIYYDDAAVDNAAYPGVGQVNILKPNAAGSTSNWTAGTGSTYAEVDEVPHDSDTTYIKSATNGNVTTVNLDSSATGGVGGTIAATKVIGIVRDEGGASSMSIRAKSSATNSDTTAVDPGATYVALAKLLATDPNTSAAWTTSGLDALEIGVVNAANVAIRCTALYAMVECAGSTVVTLDVATDAALSTTATQDLAEDAALSETATKDVAEDAALSETVTLDLAEAGVISTTNTVTTTSDATISAPAGGSTQTVAQDAAISATEYVLFLVYLTPAGQITLPFDAAIGTLHTADIAEDAAINPIAKVEIAEDAYIVLAGLGQADVTEDAALTTVFTLDVSQSGVLSETVTITIAEDAALSATGTKDVASSSVLTTTNVVTLTQDASLSQNKVDIACEACISVGFHPAPGSGTATVSRLPASGTATISRLTGGRARDTRPRGGGSANLGP